MNKKEVKDITGILATLLNPKQKFCRTFYLFFLEKKK